MSQSKRMSGNTMDFGSNLEDIEQVNDNLLGSLVRENEQIREPGSAIRESMHDRAGHALGDNLTSMLGNGALASNMRLSDQYGATQAVNRPSTNLDPQCDIPKKTYGSDREVALLVLALKLIANKVGAENVQLAQQKREHELREEQYRSKIKSLNARISELEVETRAAREKHGGGRMDLQDLDARLRAMDENLQKATGEHSQQRFIEDAVARNKEYAARSHDNAESLKQLRQNLTGLKSTLLALNTRADK